MFFQENKKYFLSSEKKSFSPEKNISFQLKEKIKSECVIFFQDLPMLKKSFSQAEDKKQEREQEKKVSAELKKRNIFSYYSVSHTRLKEMGGKIIVLGANQPIGIDLENHNRHISDRLINRLKKKDNEHIINLPPLIRWMVKEAAWKADPKNKEFFISDYKIISWSAHHQKGHVLFPSQSPSEPPFPFYVFYSFPWIIVLVTRFSE